MTTSTRQPAAGLSAEAGAAPGTQVPGQRRDEHGDALARALVRHVQESGAAGYEARIGGYEVRVRPARDPASPGGQVYDE